jgi:CDP-diacylglycerol--glycerol-3-phosphate 3-phosphatidyltransferase
MSHSPRITFTDRLRVWTRAIIDPIVTVLARLGITPNMLTVLGMVGHIPAAWFVATGRFRIAAIIGLVSLLDSLDGALARKLNAGHGGKGFGAFFDSTLDRISETILFAGLIWWFGRQGDVWLTLLAYAALTGALLVSYTRARSEALGYHCKEGLFSRVERYLVLFVCGLLLRPDWAVWVLAIGTWFTVLQRIVVVWRQSRED